MNQKEVVINSKDLQNKEKVTLGANETGAQFITEERFKEYEAKNNYVSVSLNDVINNKGGIGK